MQFWPREAACCCDGGGEEPCTNLCVTVTDYDTGAPISGATVSEDTLGSGTTDAAGVICFEGPVEGVRYVFRASSAARHDNAFAVVYAPGDCERTLTLKGDPPSGCIDVVISSCNCFVPGANVNLSIPPQGFDVDAVTDWYGRARICLSPAVLASDGTYTFTVTHADIETFVSADFYHHTANPITSKSFAVLLEDWEDRFCFRNIPDGDSGINCIEYAPATLSVTLAGDWPGGVGGATYDLALDPGSDFSWSNGCQECPDQSSFQTYGILVEANQGPLSCGVMGGVSIQVTFNITPRHPVTGACVSAPGDFFYAGNNSHEPGNSVACPIAVFTGFSRSAPSPGAAYTLDRTATITQ